MQDYNRPDPDALLRQIQKEEQKRRRGRLTIFLGMAAGVGKTYAMLQAAHRRKTERNVLIGFVETHGRAETAALLEGLPVLPRKKIEYRGVQLEEMDLDAVLERRPDVVVVDELAHTNVPGSRHAKRWQDVVEIIEAGIDVWTAVNVQHVESRSGTAAQIAGAEIRETIPDSVLDMADEIDLIDIAPDELLERLQAGRIYEGDRARRALDNFFKPERLIALRELSLRLTAEHVDQSLREQMREKHIEGPWKANERLLVAVSSSPTAGDLIRWTRRQAYILDSPWTTVYVEGSRPPDAVDRRRIESHLDLARELGAEVIVTHDENVAEGILRVARETNVTQIVLGRTGLSRFADVLRGGSITNRLLRNSGSIDIHVVAAPHKSQKETKLKEEVSSSLAGRFISNRLQYTVAALAVGIVTMLGLAALPVVGYWSISLFFLLTVLLLALVVGRGPVLLAALISALSWNFLFIPPRFTFHIYRLEDALMFGFYFVIAAVTGVLTSRVRTRENLVRRREAMTTALYRVTKELAAMDRPVSMIAVCITQLETLLPVKVSILASSEGSLDFPDERAMSDRERAVALWCFENRRPAGRFTDTLPVSPHQYLPLLSSGQIAGVMQLEFADDTDRKGADPLSSEARMLVESVAAQLASALLRVEGTRKSDALRLHAESDRLYRNILSSVSHELRTPITTIKGAASALEPHMQTSASKELLTDIVDASDRLNVLIENLLDMQRIESAHVVPRLIWSDPGDIMAGVASDAKDILNGTTIRLVRPAIVPLVFVDPVLIAQALSNLVRNAMRYSGGGEVRLGFNVVSGRPVFSVEDDGPGISPGERERVFEKFYRSNMTRSQMPGAGLGLSIAKGFVEAQRGAELRLKTGRNGGWNRFEILLGEDAVYEASSADH